MSIQYAQEIVQRLGPGRIALDRDCYESLAQELALMGCQVSDLTDLSKGGCLVLDWSDEAGLLDKADAFDTLVLRSGDAERAPVDKALFAAGWRRHPAGMLPGQCGGWSETRLPHTSYYQRCPSSAGTGPLRSTGYRADAAIARFVQASHHVRAGDHVLVDSRYADDGIAILAAQSRGAAFVVPSTDADCAESPFRLDQFADNSLDLIVALEPPADDWQIALAEYARVLRLDGRLIMGWPAGLDGQKGPQSWDALKAFAEQLFVLETGYVHVETHHMLFPADLGVEQPDWMILVACADPMDGASHRDSFVHPGFPDHGVSLPILVDFANAYDNPWLYRSMVQLGERFSNQVKLAQLAEAVIADARAESADRGAAIAVLGYRVLETRMSESVPVLLTLIEAYIGLALDERRNDRPPHVVRWGVSLAFLAGRLCELAEDRDAALRWFDMASGADVTAFSPILATKTIGASFFAGRLCLANRDMEGAAARFRRGVGLGQKATAADHASQLGNPDHPLPFYFQELAEVIDMAAQCANALFHMPLFARDPGLYWRQVDVRRFGLASWALDLERENDRLRRMH